MPDPAHEDDKREERSRDDRRDRDRDRDDRKEVRRDDRRDDKDRRDNRERNFERPPERVSGGWAQQAAANTGSMQNYEDKIKNLMSSKGGQGFSTKWGAAPENMKIHDENGEISEEFLRSTQGPANSQKLVQQELSIKFSQHLSNSKTIKPKIDQSSLYPNVSRYRV